eukprot:CAMPEP_0176465052 /NCGR_PEP_ID=MMETSP0127-20121128/36961_1 /TAXON_ID=938130 /ORGANISM="Platyophrya macrostoma, Strain WH" /LENGTH=108 /DNA_ID=CAMNT_0017857743 /DNA_START=1 /DNA_END=323 /DNA_ORIENTATION=+
MYFQAKDPYGERAILVYEFHFDPYLHPLRTIIPIKSAQKDYGYLLKVASGRQFSVALVIDSLNAANRLLLQVHWMPTLFLTTNQEGYNASSYQKSYEFDVKVSSALKS